MLTASHSKQTRHWSVLGAVATGWRRVIGIRAAELQKVARSCAGDVEHLKHDANSSSPALRQPLTRGPNEANLLPRRMASLDLDPYELAVGEAALFHHLQSRCMLCEAWLRCRQDLTSDSVGSARQDRQEWLDYCPNASTLETLRVLHSCTKIAPRYLFPYLG